MDAFLIWFVISSVSFGEHICCTLVKCDFFVVLVTLSLSVNKIISCIIILWSMKNHRYDVIRHIACREDQLL